MAVALKPGWSKPSTILLACEIPINERSLAFAVAQAQQFGAEIILFHAYDTMASAATESSDIRYYDFAAAARVEIQQMTPLAKRVRKAGVKCEVVVRRGLAVDQILKFQREREIDRIVMGTHSPGPIGKLLVGSVAEAVLRTASVPVFIVGPDVLDGSYRKFATRTILCAVSQLGTRSAVARFAAELAAQHNARLILQHVIKPQERAQLLACQSIDKLEAELLALIPEKLQKKIAAEALVVTGDPTEELLYQGAARQADLIVLGAQGASAFAAVARHGVVYKVLAHSQCPVITLSPLVLAERGAKAECNPMAEVYLAGVF